MVLKGREILDATGGNVLSGPLDVSIDGFSIDTRTINPGDWFVPLKGEHTDGEYYLEEALRKGAAGAFTTRDKFSDRKTNALLLKVPHTLQALHDTARYHRQKHDLDVIGVTGSSGKTTTKDLIASVLSQKYNVLKTEGNLNNEIGLPLMLLRIKKNHQVAVLELAMRGKGEITLLSQLASPQWGVITNIGEAHLENLGSIEEIARAKGELLDNLPKQGVALLNGDDPRIISLGKKFSGKTYWYGEKEQNHFQIKDSWVDLKETYFKATFPVNKETKLFSVPLPGKHHAMNAVAALALGYFMEVKEKDLQLGLKESENLFTWGRTDVKKGRRPGVTVIDDSYNANPASVRSALETLSSLSEAEKAVVVLGDMLELGKITENAHREIGKLVADYRIKCLIAVGDHSKYIAEETIQRGIETYHCANVSQACDLVLEIENGLEEGSFILVKGSRSIMLDKLVNKLVKGEPE